MIYTDVTEEQFLDLYKFTRKKVTPLEFLKSLNVVVNANKKISYNKGYNDGFDRIYNEWTKSLDIQSKLLF